jgi:hypothetical protein
VPRHPSFLLKTKITILDIFYISLSLSLSLTGEEGVGTLASIKQSRTLSIPYSVSQSVSMRDYLILILGTPFEAPLQGCH